MINIDQFRKNIKIVRTAKGISGRELSERAGLKEKRIHDIEEGRGMPKLSEVCSICRVLDCQIDLMLYDQVEIKFNFKSV